MLKREVPLPESMLVLVRAQLEEMYRDRDGPKISSLKEHIERNAGDDDVEWALNAHETTTKLFLIQTAYSRRGCAEEALRLMDEGAYGVCLDCGGDIGIQRIQAMPQSLYCVQCAPRANHRLFPSPVPVRRVPPKTIRKISFMNRR